MGRSRGVMGSDKILTMYLKKKKIEKKKFFYLFNLLLIVTIWNL